jgi:hypothetical protein
MDTEAREQSSFDRVRQHTSSKVNAKIDRETAARINEYERLGPVERGRRLGELDREWDIDRGLMLLFSAVGGLTFTLGMTRMRPWRRWNGWLSLFSTQVGFMGFHAAIGWCPPVVLLRRLGIRTRKEIDRERQSIEALDDPESRAAAHA